MKALSIKQPWAWLIAKGIKDIENRQWRIGRKAIGGYPLSGNTDFGTGLQFPFRVYIHAGKTPESDMEDSLDFIKSINHDAYQYIFSSIMNDEPNLTLGAIIGEVDIIDCVKDSKSPWAVQGQYHFVLANAKLYPEPISYRGQLGFFEVTPP